jgi:hypothetical protein
MYIYIYSGEEGGGAVKKKEEHAVKGVRLAYLLQLTLNPKAVKEEEEHASDKGVGRRVPAIALGYLI